MSQSPIPPSRFKVRNLAILFTILTLIAALIWLIFEYSEIEPVTIVLAEIAVLLGFYSTKQVDRVLAIGLIIIGVLILIFGSIRLIQRFERKSTFTQLFSIPVNASNPYYQENFEKGAKAEWSSNAIDETPSGQLFLGQFGNEQISLTLEDLPDHDYIVVELDLFIIRSWDGNQRETPFARDIIAGPDIWGIKMENNELFRTTFSNNIDHFGQNYTQSYPDAFFSERLPGTGAAEIDSLGYEWTDDKMDSIYNVIFRLEHSNDVVSIDFFGENLEDIFNESWGIDSVRVYALKKE